MTQISNFHIKLKTLRMLRGIHQKELCKRTGINPNILVEYEKGRAMPSDEQLAEIEKALAIKFNDQTEAAFAILAPALGG